MLTLAAASFALAPFALDEGKVQLEYRTYRDWKLELPAEEFSPLSTELPGGFAVRLDGLVLVVDADGDGTPERSIEGHVDDAGIRSAMVVCRRGDEAPRGFRLLDRGAGWSFAPAGAAVGKIGDTQVLIVDQNNDGRFDGYGSDALIVGSGKRAHFLSDVVNVSGALYTIDVAADGSSLDFAPFAGEAGTLDFTTALDTEAKLLTAVVVSADGRRSFDLAGAPSGMLVPAGEYAIHSGRLGLGKAKVEVQPAGASTLTVTGGERSTLDWGGPVRAEFAFQRQGSEVAFHPDYVWYYGSAGEQYLGWHPIGKSPEFTVRERGAGTELAKAVFPGST